MSQVMEELTVIVENKIQLMNIDQKAIRQNAARVNDNTALGKMSQILDIGEVYI